MRKTRARIAAENAEIARTTAVEPSTAASAEIARYVDEASSVLTFESSEQIEIQLGHLCNNRCVFCPSGQLTEMGLAGQLPVEPIYETLAAAAARGVRKVTFLGGEPTLQRTFTAALEKAIALGFTDIVIFTNGVTSKSRKFIEEMVSLGTFTWRFSIQGGNEEAHDRVTLRPGSFARIIQGLTFLRKLDQKITVNMCVNEYSYHSLPDYPELLTAYGVTQFHVDIIRPNNTGVRSDEYLREIMPRYSVMAPFFAEMLRRFEETAPAFDVNVGNLPFCVMPEWAHKIHHGGQPTTIHALDGEGELGSRNKYEYQRSDMVFAESCARCVFQPECRGIPEKYAQFYGFGEFVPVTLGDLRGLDSASHFFVLLNAPVVVPLLASPPAPWRIETIFRGTRDRVLELWLRHASGSAAVLRLTPEAEKSSLITTTELSLGLTADASTPRPDRVELLQWADRALAQSPDLHVVDRRAMERQVSSLRQSGNQVRIIRSAQRLKTRREINGWLYVDAHMQPDSGDALVRFRHPGHSAEVTVVLHCADDQKVRVARVLPAQISDRALIDALGQAVEEHCQPVATRNL